MISHLVCGRVRPKRIDKIESATLVVRSDYLLNAIEHFIAELRKGARQSTTRTIFPRVCRASIASCARRASASGNVLSMTTRRDPSSISPRSVSSRFALGVDSMCEIAILRSSATSSPTSSASRPPLRTARIVVLALSSRPTQSSAAATPSGAYCFTAFTMSPAVYSTTSVAPRSRT